MAVFAPTGGQPVGRGDGEVLSAPKRAHFVPDMLEHTFSRRHRRSSVRVASCYMTCPQALPRRTQQASDVPKARPVTRHPAYAATVTRRLATCSRLGPLCSLAVTHDHAAAYVYSAWGPPRRGAATSR